VAAFDAGENLPLPVVEAPRRLGHDVMTAVEAGQAKEPGFVALAACRGVEPLDDDVAERGLRHDSSDLPCPRPRAGSVSSEVRRDG
jgi:hypothetical protein